LRMYKVWSLFGLWSHPFGAHIQIVLNLHVSLLEYLHY
jgi:hypothetical protein